MDIYNIKDIMKEGVRFIASAQTGDGDFLTLSFPPKKDFRDARTYRTTFAASLILSCLSILKDTPGVKPVMEKVSAFLLSQKNDRWSFNYWSRNSEEARSRIFPNDLDCTFCALLALHAYNPRTIGAEVLWKISTILAFMEKNKGGPYRTWITPLDDPKGQDVDVAVNANIAYFLSLYKIEPPALRSFIETAIDSRNYSSPYYVSEYPIIYFIARYYRGEKQRQLAGFLLQKLRKDGWCGNPLYTALAISSLLRLGIEPAKLRRSIDCLLRVQKGGVWGLEALYIDPPIHGRTYYGGSSALTTAFCLEALALYESMWKR